MIGTGLTLLSGIRVLALEQFIAGPFCTSILADAGAEVIKIERPGEGDPRRSYEPRLFAPTEPPGGADYVSGGADYVSGGADFVSGGADYVSGGFASYNRGKRSIELDLATEDGKARLAALLDGADVLVSNLRPGALNRQGLAVPRLRAAYPRLVICEISGFGAGGGPYAGWPAFDSVIQAMSGLSSLIGSADGPPGSAPMGSMDLLSGVYAAVGILAALVNRSVSGSGCHVDAAMYDIGAAFLERPLTLHEFTGAVPTRGADRFSPVGTFRAGDGGWLSIVIPTDDMWRRCCVAIGRDDLLSDPELDTVLRRAELMATRIVPALEAWAADKDRFAAAAALREAGQPVGVVQDIAEVRRCPQLAHRGLFAPFVDDRAPADGSMRLPRLPLAFDGAVAAPGPVPQLGEDNDEPRWRQSSASPGSCSTAATSARNSEPC